MLSAVSPFDVTFTAQRLVATVVGAAVWTAVAFGAGYLYKAHKVQVEDASKEGRQEAVTTTTHAAAKTIDGQAVSRLSAKLDAANARARTLQQMIEDQSNATPASPDCRLPDRLRDELNRDLAADRPAPAGEVR